MTTSTSCRGCLWLFTHDVGYSNWTVEDTELHCMHGRNPLLPVESISRHDGLQRDSEYIDRLPATAKGRCDLWLDGGYSWARNKRMLHIDVEKEALVSAAEAEEAMLNGDPRMRLLRAYFKRDSR